MNCTVTRAFRIEFPASIFSKTLRMSGGKMKYFVWSSNQSSYNSGCFAEFKAAHRKQWGGIPQQCRFCGATIGVKHWRGPFVAEIDNRPIGDLCTDGLDILFSPEAQKAIFADRLTGLSFGETPIEFINHPEIRDFRVCRYTAVEQSLDTNLSGLEMSRFVGCGQCMLCSRKKLDRIVFSPPVCELDVFLPSCLYGVIIVSEKFVETVKNHKLTNFCFISQDDYQVP